MKKVVLLVFALAFQCLAFAQVNLVPNPSFEDTVACPNAGNQVDRAVGWYPSRNTPDYFNGCDWINGLLGVPNNAFGYQYAHTGDAYCGAIVYSRNDSTYRENFTCKLLSPLAIGKKYLVSFYVSQADNYNRLACNKLGLLLSTVNFDSINNSPTHNYAQFFSDSIITDTANWTYLSGTILADSNYSYLSIGIFFESYLIDTAYIFPAYANVYYYIDDIAVFEDTSTSLASIEGNNAVSVYPNPVQDFLTIKSKSNNLLYIEIVNTVGQLMLYRKAESIKTKIDLSTLKPGIYYLKLTFKNKTLNINKLLKL